MLDVTIGPIGVTRAVMLTPIRASRSRVGVFLVMLSWSPWRNIEGQPMTSMSLNPSFLTKSWVYLAAHAHRPGSIEDRPDEPPHAVIETARLARHVGQRALVADAQDDDRDLQLLDHAGVAGELLGERRAEGVGERDDVDVELAR